jgi:hypothetical protein
MYRTSQISLLMIPVRVFLHPIPLHWKLPNKIVYVQMSVGLQNVPSLYVYLYVNKVLYSLPNAHISIDEGMPHSESNDEVGFL